MLDPHIPLIEFPDAGAALCYMVECTMATLEHQRDIKRTSKSESDAHDVYQKRYAEKD